LTAFPTSEVELPLLSLNARLDDGALVGVKFSLKLVVREVLVAKFVPGEGGNGSLSDLVKFLFGFKIPFGTDGIRGRPEMFKSCGVGIRLARFGTILSAMNTMSAMSSET